MKSKTPEELVRDLEAYKANVDTRIKNLESRMVKLSDQALRISGTFTRDLEWLQARHDQLIIYLLGAAASLGVLALTVLVYCVLFVGIQ